MSSPLTFRQITAADRDIFVQVVEHSLCRNCDMSLANIYCWQDSYHSQIATWHGWLIIRFTTDRGDIAYMQPMGNGERSEVIQCLRADAASLGAPLRLFGLDSSWVKSINDLYTDQFAVYASPSNADYIYLADDLATLPGRKYQPKRNHINRFTQRYNFRLERISESNLEDCRQLNTLWCNQKGVKSSDPEQKALSRALSEFRALNLRGWILYADNTPAAFAIGSQINHDTFCIHIEKSDINFDGASAMINNLVAVEISKEYKYINREDDLGIAGLRRAKQSYHPTIMLTKHSALMLTEGEQNMRHLWQECFGDDITTIDHFFTTVYNPKLCFTHSINGTVVAMLHLVPVRYGNSQHGYIYAVATDRAFRRQGIASQLIQRAIEYAKECGEYKSLILIPADEAAQRLYSRFGFEMRDSIFVQPENYPDYDLGSGNSTPDFVMTLNFL